MKVLIVSPAYAPFGGVGSARMISLSQYLVAQGDEVFVLCNDPACWPENSLTRKAPESVQVRMVKASLTEKEGASHYAQVLSGLLSEHSFDVMLCSMGPFYAPYFLKKGFTTIPCVLDYRDPWLFDYGSIKGILRKIKATLRSLHNLPDEFPMIRSAALVVAVSPAMVTSFKRRYGRFVPHVECVYNGYEPYQPKEVPEKMPREGLRIVLNGKFTYYNEKGAAMLIEAVKRLNARGIPATLVHMGLLEKRTEQLVREVGLDPDQYVNLGNLPYDACMSVIRMGDVSGLIYRSTIGLGTKIFDYIQADRPILAYTPRNSVLWAELSKCENAFRCGTAEEMLSTLIKIAEEKLTTLGIKNPERYSRAHQNERYRQLLQAVCGDRKAEEIRRERR